MAFTKVLGPGIHTLANFHSHNINSSGIITATKFIGDMTVGSGSTGTFSSLTVTGNLGVGGTLTYMDVTNVDAVGIITAQEGIHFGIGATAGKFLASTGITTISSLKVSNLNSGRVTYTGSDGDLVDSSKLTFNGADLLIDAETNEYKGIKFDNSFNLTFGSSAGTSARLYLKGTSNGEDDAGDTFLGTGTGGEQWFQSNTFTAFKVDADGTTKEALRISSGGGVGINTTVPAEKLSVSVDGNQRENFAKFEHIGQQNFFIQGQWGDRDIGGANGTLLYGSGTVALRAATSGDAHLVNLASGNIGIGTGVPVGNLEVRDTKANLIVAKDGLTVKSNSDLATQYDMIQLGAGGALASYSTATATADTQLVHNAYRASSDGNWKRRYQDTAMHLRMNSPANAFRFFNAATGNADTDITWSEKLRIDANGKLQIGSTTATGYNNFDGIGSLNLANNSADGTVDYTQGIVFCSNASNEGTWTHAGIVATGSSGYNGNLIFATDGSAARDNAASNLTERLRITSTGAVVIRHNGATASDGYAGLEVRSTKDKFNLLLSSKDTAADDNKVKIGFKLHSSAQDERVKAGILVEGNGGAYGEPDFMDFCLDGVADNGSVATSTDDSVFTIFNKKQETYGADDFAITDSGDRSNATQAHPKGTIQWQTNTGQGNTKFLSYIQTTGANEGDMYITIRNGSMYRITVKKSHDSTSAVFAMYLVYGLNGGSSSYPIKITEVVNDSGFTATRHNYKVNSYDQTLKISHSGACNQGLRALVEVIGGF